MSRLRGSHRGSTWSPSSSGGGRRLRGGRHPGILRLHRQTVCKRRVGRRPASHVKWPERLLKSGAQGPVERAFSGASIPRFLPSNSLRRLPSGDVCSRRTRLM